MTLYKVLDEEGESCNGGDAKWHLPHKLPDGRSVWDLLEDERSRKAVEVSERYAEGEATKEERAAAGAAAWAAAWAAAGDAQTKELVKILEEEGIK